ncbi:MAG: hypothetical protein K2Q18_16090, partial [Bdellovibrionales bacterium]|nr:hypothetical protein [Bdellovibrionales bacterium]
MINLILILYSTINFSFAVESNCEYFKYCGSGSSRSQSSSQSYPSTSTSSSFNPSNISKIKGVGVETLIQPNNPVGFSLASGTGKFGGALISPNLENGFFGNRSFEIDQDYLARRVDTKRYKGNKLSLAIGVNLVTKNNFSVDLGVAIKRHKEIKKLNPGAGVSLTFYILNFGFAYYSDDTKVKFDSSTVNLRSGGTYSAQYNAFSYQENFKVMTYSVGAKLGSLALDFGRIHTAYNFYNKAPTKITI